MRQAKTKHAAPAAVKARVSSRGEYCPLRSGRFSADPSGRVASGGVFSDQSAPYLLSETRNPVFRYPLKTSLSCTMKSIIMSSKPDPPFGSLTEVKKGGGSGNILFVTNRIHIWKKKILQLCFLKVDLQTLEKISSRLDADGRDILWHLWEKGHAGINELAELIRAPPITCMCWW